MRGEYLPITVAKVSVKGSPPHAWGIQPSKSSGLLGTRITPTCVGNTVEYTLKKLGIEDHPHMRGEYPGHD